MGDNKYIRVVIYSLMAAFFLSLSSLLALYAACLPWPDLCNVPNAWTLAAIAPILLVLLGVGSAYRAKALKAARGRTQARPVLPSGFDFHLPSIFPAYQVDKVDMLDESTRGWQVPFDDGTRVNVYRRTMYQWLVECYQRQRHLMAGKQSAISRRSNLKLELSQYQARLYLLNKAGAVIRNSTAPNSTPFLREYSGMDPPAASWHIIEEIEERYEPSVMIF
jgi:hypothetical protein